MLKIYKKYRDMNNTVWHLNSKYHHDHLEGFKPVTLGMGLVRYGPTSCNTMM